MVKSTTKKSKKEKGKRHPGCRQLWEPWWRGNCRQRWVNTWKARSKGLAAEKMRELREVVSGRRYMHIA